jgi:hypothetical protein
LDPLARHRRVSVPVELAHERAGRAVLRRRHLLRLGVPLALPKSASGKLVKREMQVPRRLSSETP